MRTNIEASLHSRICSAKTSLGLNTNRDSVVYDFARDHLIRKVKHLIGDYNLEVDRHKRDREADFPDHIKWSSRLKECLSRGQYAIFEESKLRRALYRPYAERWVFFDAVLNQRTFQWPHITGQVLSVTGIASGKRPSLRS